MPDRLDIAFASQRRFVANASHELRTSPFLLVGVYAVDTLRVDVLHTEEVASSCCAP
jgi:signal transduction histidine kinase